jgi:diguanylate cyclase (GGDEF)-like protein
VLVDLDDLKRVNDTLGHVAGDRLLALFAMTLRRGLPEAARLYRWGGDEFVVVVPGAEPGVTSREVAAILAAADPMRVGSGDVPLAASLGESVYADGADLEAAVARADARMYHDKVRRKSGRNLLAVAG